MISPSKTAICVAVELALAVWSLWWGVKLGRRRALSLTGDLVRRAYQTGFSDGLERGVAMAAPDADQIPLGPVPGGDG